MKILLVGLAVESLKDPIRRRIFVDVDNDTIYQILIYPNNKPWNRGQILKFIGQHYGIAPGDVVWPDHIKNP